MATPRVTIKNNVTTHWTEYTNKDIKKLWHEKGQGHEQAICRGAWCVVAKCTEQEAVEISLYFVRKFAIPTCTHYDGKTISLYCGEAGSGAPELMAVTKGFIDGFLKSNKPIQPTVGTAA